MSPAGDGRFEALPVNASSPQDIWRVHPRFAVVADFNGDNVGDLFVAAHGFDHPPFPGEQNVLLLSGPDGLTDVSRTNIPIQNDFAHGVNAGDVDGDGDLDLVVVTHHSQTRIDNYVLLNDGKGQFTQVGLDTILDESLALALKEGVQDRSKYLQLEIDDLDGDGHLDLLLLASGDGPDEASRYPGFHFSRVVYGDGSGKWQRANAVQLPRPRWGLSSHTTDAALIDIDDDGDTDLILAHAGVNTSPATRWRGSFIQILRSDGRSFVDITYERMHPQGYFNEDVRFPRRLMPVDLNADARMDLVVSTEAPWNPCAENETWRTAPVIIAQEDGSYLPLDPRRMGMEECSAWNLAALDVDGDGDIDLTSGRSLGEIGSDGRFYSFGLKMETILNDPTRRAMLPKPKFDVRTEQVGDDRPGDQARIAVGVRSFFPELGEDYSIKFDIKATLVGGQVKVLQLVVGDGFAEANVAAVKACGAQTELWDDDRHHVVIGFMSSGQTFRAVGMECLLAALPEDVGSKAVLLIDHFRDIAIGVVTKDVERQIDHANTRAFMASVAMGDLVISR